MLPNGQVKPVGVFVGQLAPPCDLLTDTRVKPVGHVSATTTLLASDIPVLVTVIAYLWLTGSPANTVARLSLLAIPRAALLTTVVLSLTEGDEPASEPATTLLVFIPAAVLDGTV